MNKHFKHRMEDVFGFTKTETNGFFILLVISFISLLIWYISPVFVQPDESTDPAKEAYLDSINTLLSSCYENTSLFSFDPNKIGSDSLFLLGLNHTAQSALTGFREKGGIFSYREQLKKIYGIDKDLFSRIRPYIDLPDSTTYFRSHSNRTPDINTIDYTGLTKIPHAGALAGRILKYRELLGGFVHTSQYNEIFGMDSLAQRYLEKNTMLSGNFVPIKIKINTATEEAMSRHPYISKELATDIVRYRQINGRIDDLHLLKKFRTLNSDGFKKLFPYLEI